MKILIMGLPGSGKTTLAEELQRHLNCAWYNADVIRKMANDWEFSDDARNRQAYRMRLLADVEKDNDKTVICDFVCPTKNTRSIFNTDITIWMNTIKESRFNDTNNIFEKPEDVNIMITEWLADKDIELLVEKLKKEYYV